MAKLSVTSEPSAPKPLAEAGAKLRNLKDRKAIAEEALTQINKEIVEMETVTLPKLMDDNDIPSFKIKGVGTIFLSTEVYASVLKEDRPKLYDWLREHGHGAMVTDWVFPISLTAFVKKQLDDQLDNGLNDGNVLPDFVKATKIPTANLRRSK